MPTLAQLAERQGQAATQVATDITGALVALMTQLGNQRQNELQTALFEQSLRVNEQSAQRAQDLGLQQLEINRRQLELGERAEELEREKFTRSNAVARIDAISRQFSQAMTSPDFDTTNALQVDKFVSSSALQARNQGPLGVFSGGMGEKQLLRSVVKEIEAEAESFRRALEEEGRSLEAQGLEARSAEEIQNEVTEAVRTAFDRIGSTGEATRQELMLVILDEAAAQPQSVLQGQAERIRTLMPEVAQGYESIREERAIERQKETLGTLGAIRQAVPGVELSDDFESRADTPGEKELIDLILGGKLGSEDAKLALQAIDEQLRFGSGFNEDTQEMGTYTYGTDPATGRQIPLDFKPFGEAGLATEEAQREGDELRQLFGEGSPLFDFSGQADEQRAFLFDLLKSARGEPRAQRIMSPPQPLGPQGEPLGPPQNMDMPAGGTAPQQAAAPAPQQELQALANRETQATGIPTAGSTEPDTDRAAESSGFAAQQAAFQAGQEDALRQIAQREQEAQALVAGLQGLSQDLSQAMTPFENMQAQKQLQIQDLMQQVGQPQVQQVDPVSAMLLPALLQNLRLR